MGHDLLCLSRRVLIRRRDFTRRRAAAVAIARRHVGDRGGQRAQRARGTRNGAEAGDDGAGANPATRVAAQSVGLTRPSRPARERERGFGHGNRVRAPHPAMRLCRGAGEVGARSAPGEGAPNPAQAARAAPRTMPPDPDPAPPTLTRRTAVADLSRSRGRGDDAGRARDCPAVRPVIASPVAAGTLLTPRPDRDWRAHGWHFRRKAVAGWNLSERSWSGGRGCHPRTRCWRCEKASGWTYIATAGRS